MLWDFLNNSALRETKVVVIFGARTLADEKRKLGIDSTWTCTNKYRNNVGIVYEFQQIKRGFMALGH